MRLIAAHSRVESENGDVVLQVAPSIQVDLLDAEELIEAPGDGVWVGVLGSEDLAEVLMADDWACASNSVGVPAAEDWV